MICQIVNSSSWLDSTIAAFREACPIQLRRRLHRQVRQVAGVQADADRFVPGAAQALERGDGVRHAAAERVDRVHEQHRVVRVHVGVGVEGSLPHRRRGRGTAEPSSGRACRPARRRARRQRLRWTSTPRRRRSPPATPRSAPSAAARRMPNSSTGRRRDASTTRAAFVAISVEKLSWLSSGVSSSWAAANEPSTTVIGVFGWTTRPSGTASMRSAAEVGAAEPRAGSRRRRARSPLRERWRAQRLDVRRRRPCRRRPVGERSQPGGHAVARLVVAVVRVRPEEVLEPHAAIVQPGPHVQLGHRQLVGVRAQDAARERVHDGRHPADSTAVP